ncbi:inner nuclear membrane protein Man1-like isoform X1 [Onthophagus taurus]|uniref:inner nuclear membrane protein Man1-like isoform X1 n=1 Tax=Onthophagus taurus TaxID=166361 RepID=UPI0039BDD67B
MIDVENLSDAEIRSKLLEFGFPVMPITGTTRKVMVKKLKILLENKAKTTSNDNRRSLGKYSSEEESDSDSVRPTSKPRRITMGAPASKVPVRRTLRSDPDENEVNKVMEEKKVVSKTTNIVKMIENDFDTGSDTESEVIETTNNHESPQILPTSSFLNLKRSQPKNISPDTSSFLISSRFNSSDYAADRLNQIRSRLSLNTTTGYNKPYGTTINTNVDEDKVDTPFLSSFTRRLSRLSTQVPSESGEMKNESSSLENDTNGSTFGTPKYMSRPVKRDFVRDYHQTGKRSHLKNNLVSCALIAFAILFFVGLAILYMGMRDGLTDVDRVSGKDLAFPRCDPKNVNHKRGKTCVLEEEVREAADLYRSLKSELTKIAVDRKCAAPAKGFLTESDIFKHIKKNLPDIYDAKLVLSNLHILALSNPKWEIALIRDLADETVLENPISDIDDLEKLIENDGKVVLAVLNPEIPWKCTLYNKLSAIVQLVVLVIGVLVIGYLGNTGYKYLKHFRQKQKDELYYMVERIVDTLQGNASEEGDNYLIINHVRDMIIPINDRSRMEKVWKKAIKFINENESRVRTEMQVVQGEPYEVWRWLGNPNINTSNVRNKSWQGQAFETQVGSVNSLPCSPTPCLKVRGMVDDGDRNLLTIREAVLSKCAHQCRILHCAVDTTSQCVYIKCANQADAAIAYRSLHGWWYAGNLVTVKYLRLERYMQRYPDSPVSGPPYLKAVQPGTEWVR